MRSAPAWAISLLIHGCLVIVIGSLWISKPSGTGGAQDRPVGVAVVYESGGGEEYFLGQGLGSEASSTAEEAAASLPASSSAVTLQNPLADLLPGSATAAGDAAAAAGSLGLGDGGAELGGNRSIPKVKTTVFGIEGEGTRFLYVFDRSDSMNGYGGRPLWSAKSELLTSLESLGPAHQFQIVFYNDTPLPFGGSTDRGPQLLKGEAQSKAAAGRFVRDVVAVGGTRHIDALRMAVSMAPDVIFFLTDADQPAPPSRDIENLHVRCSRIGATVHSIQFGAGPNQSGGGWIAWLASGTGGQYRYLDVTELRN